MTTTVSAGAAQRAVAVRGGAVATGLAGLAALLAGGSPVPVVVMSVLAVAAVLFRPHGSLPALGFTLVVLTWSFWAPHATAWVVVAAAALIGAHVLIAIGDATSGATPLPPETLARLGRQALVVLAVACAASAVAVARVTVAASTHIWLGVLAVLVVVGWVSWLRLRPRG